MDVILLAAGLGTRLNSDEPKQFVKIKGKPLFIYSLELFKKSPMVENIIITCNENYFDKYFYYTESYKIENVKFVLGGSTRQESVYQALQHVSSERVLIHEAARPLVDTEFLDQIINSDPKHAAVLPTIPIKFSVSIGAEFMEATLDRSKLHNIQLPQNFNTSILKDSHTKAREDGFETTEDGMLVFHYGNAVKFVQGRESNIKITTKLDVELIEKLLSV